MEMLQNLNKHSIPKNCYKRFADEISIDWKTLADHLEMPQWQRRNMRKDYIGHTNDACHFLIFNIFLCDDKLDLLSLYTAIEQIKRKQTLGKLLLEIAEKALLPMYID